MAAKYRKIDPRIWRDEKFRRLKQTDKLLVLYVLTSSQANRLGIFGFSVGMAAEETGDTYETCARRLRGLSQTFGWSWDESNGVVYLPQWWKYNQPENQFVMKGNLSDLHDLPETPLLDLFFSNEEHLCKSSLACLKETSARRLPRRQGAQEQEQEQEQEQDKRQICSEPLQASEPTLADSSPAFLDFPTVGNGGKSWTLTEAKVEEYAGTFPGVDIRAESRKAWQWCQDNPAKRKTAKGMPAFLSRWFGKVQDGPIKPTQAHSSHHANGKPKPGTMEHIQYEFAHMWDDATPEQADEAKRKFLESRGVL